MHISLDCRMIENSGIGVYLKNIVENLVEYKNIQLTLIHRKDDLSHFSCYKSVAHLKENNAEIYTVKELLSGIRSSYKSDIFWTPHYNVPIVNLAARAKIVTIHDVMHLAYKRELSVKQRVYAECMLRIAIKSDIIFTVSDFSKSEIIRLCHCNPDKIHVVHNGVNIEKFSTVSDTKEKLPVADPYVLYVGNVKFYKNLKNALLGFKEFILSGPDFAKDMKFLIVGKKDGFIIGDEELAVLLNSDVFLNRRVLFTDKVSDEMLVRIYQSASCLVFPSFYEGFGFPPLEAMAAGTPVLASTSASIPEICGDGVLYFNPLKPAEIAECFHAIMTDEKKSAKMIEYGKQHVTKFNWKDTVKKKVEVIQDLLQ